MKKKQYEYDFVFKNELDMTFAFKALVDHCEAKGWANNITEFNKANLATLIDKFKGLSQRYLAELVFRKNDPRHGIQMCGRDVKRWAAEIVGNLEEAKGSWAN
jgi:hypothetical protein